MVEVVWNFQIARFCAVTTGRAFLIDVTRPGLHRDGIVTRLAAQRLDFGHGNDLYTRVFPDPLVVDFQTAGGVAKFGEISVEGSYSPTQGGALLKQDHVIPGFRRLNCSGDSGDAAAYNQNGLTRWSLVQLTSPFARYAMFNCSLIYLRPLKKP